MGRLGRFKGLSERLESIASLIFIFAGVCVTLALFVSMASFEAAYLFLFTGGASAFAGNVLLLVSVILEEP
jgi:hypothetical protein